MINTHRNVQLDCIGHCINDLESAWDTITTPIELWRIAEDALSKTGHKNIAFYSRSASVFQHSNVSQLHVIQLSDKSLKSEIKLTKQDQDTILRNLESQFQSQYIKILQLKTSPFEGLDDTQPCLKVFENDAPTYVMRHFGPNCQTGYTIFNIKEGSLSELNERVNFLRALLGSIHDKLAHMQINSSHLKPKISPREKQVLQLLVKGKTNIEIAKGLSISPYTIGSYINALGLKLSSRNRTTTAIKAVALGLVSI